MKKLRFAALFAALFAVVPGLVSCEPESLDPDANVNAPAEENVFWNVVGQLVNDRDYGGESK